MAASGRRAQPLQRSVARVARERDDPRSSAPELRQCAPTTAPRARARRPGGEDACAAAARFRGRRLGVRPSWTRLTSSRARVRSSITTRRTLLPCTRAGTSAAARTCRQGIPACSRTSRRRALLPCRMLTVVLVVDTLGAWMLGRRPESGRKRPSGVRLSSLLPLYVHTRCITPRDLCAIFQSSAGLLIGRHMCLSEPSRQI